jgi:protein-tyrosine phosphatase
MAVYDLTCEFPQTKGAPEGVKLFFYPMLDGVLDEQEILRAAERGLEILKSHHLLLVHCALGKARSVRVAKKIIELKAYHNP